VEKRHVLMGPISVRKVETPHLWVRARRCCSQSMRLQLAALHRSVLVSDDRSRISA
jgi:hypothetical protein